MSEPRTPTDTILEERQATHGDFLDVAVMAGKLKDVMRNSRSWSALHPAMRESLDLIATKIARILSGDPFHADSWQDIAGYATLSLRAIPDPAPADDAQPTL